MRSGQNFWGKKFSGDIIRAKVYSGEWVETILISTTLKGLQEDGRVSGCSNEPIFMKCRRWVQIHSRMNPLVVGKYARNRTTDMG